MSQQPRYYVRAVTGMGLGAGGFDIVDRKTGQTSGLTLWRDEAERMARRLNAWEIPAWPEAVDPADSWKPARGRGMTRYAYDRDYGEYLGHPMDPRSPDDNGYGWECDRCGRVVEPHMIVEDLCPKCTDEAVQAELDADLGIKQPAHESPLVWAVYLAVTLAAVIASSFHPLPWFGS